MKRLIILVLGITVLTTSCSKDFLNLDEGKNISNIEGDIKSLYTQFASPRFFGRNIMAIGDISADNVLSTKSSSDMHPMYKYDIKVDNRSLLEIWVSGYRIYHSSTCLISDIDNLVRSASEEDKSKLSSYQAQAYALRAMSNFYLVNIFSLPYSVQTADSPGLLLLKGCENAEEKRSTLKETYDAILSDIDKSIKLFDNSDEKLTPQDINKDAILILNSKVLMILKDYDSALKSLELIDKGFYSLIDSGNSYFEMWGSTELNHEDIFIIGRKYQTYNYLTCLNSLYTFQGMKISESTKEIFSENDYRSKVIEFETREGFPAKFRGSISDANKYNVPVFRLSEVYLLSAEAKAHLNDASAVDDLFEIAKRNVDLKKSDIPTSGQALLNFISEERRRELYQEGHRWFDMRRTGEIMTNRTDLDNGKFDLQKFVYPIPLFEINASGIEQNDWLSGLPNQS